MKTIIKLPLKVNTNFYGSINADIFVYINSRPIVHCVKKSARV